MIITHVWAAILGAALAAWGTWQVQDWRHTAAESRRIEAEQETARLRARAASQASAAHEQTRAQVAAEIRTVTVEVDRVVERPVYRDRCIDDDGLQLIARAIGQRAADPGEPGPAVPAAGRPD